MLIGTMTTSQPQHIRMIDQHGQAVDLDVRQDGRAPGLVPPGRRVRFKIRAPVLAYRVSRLVLPEAPDDWHVYDIYVGAQSQFSNLGDTSEGDGCPGGVFAPQMPSMISFATVQTAMDFARSPRPRTSRA
jgi:hypothetical protein